MAANWDEAKYIINKILSGVKLEQVTGIPPRNMTNFSVSAGNQQIKIKAGVPDNTVIDGQLICTCAGVRIMRKASSAPIGPEDGTLVLDLKAGNVADLVDTGLVNGVTYYYAFYPYSDHGVYNYNMFNVLHATPSPIKYWAFDQNFADKNPATTITYPTGFTNSNFAKMLTNEGTGTATYGGWEDFLKETLKNYPAMVKKTGEIDYLLNPADYTKKKEGGTASDYKNLNYNGGAFAWLNRIYMLETYSGNKESREVQFADGPADGFTPVGFYDGENNVLEGIWLPMGYMDASGRTLIAGTTPVASKTCDQEKALIDGFSSRARFLGGPIMNVLRDLEYMLFKSTDIQLQAGHGRCNAGSQAVVANAVVANGAVEGWKGTNAKTQMNKYFHSQVLGSYQQWTRDPYTITIGGVEKMSPNYNYNLAGNGYINAGVTLSTNPAWWYASHLIPLADPKLGSQPKQENTGSTTTGICDGGPYGNTAGTRVALRLGDCIHDLIGGPAALNLNNEASPASWNFGVGVILLPPAGYAPQVA